MFPEAPPRRRYRLCMHCNRSFDSSSAAERVCSKCRRKHNKLLEKYGGIITYVSTPQMSLHIKKVEENAEIENMLSEEKIKAFLDGKDIDDSCVYRAIKEKDKIAAPVTEESRAVIFLKKVIEEGVNVKEKRVKFFCW